MPKQTSHSARHLGPESRETDRFKMYGRRTKLSRLSWVRDCARPSCGRPPPAGTPDRGSPSLDRSRQSERAASTAAPRTSSPALVCTQTPHRTASTTSACSDYQVSGPYKPRRRVMNEAPPDCRINIAMVRMIGGSQLRSSWLAYSPECSSCRPRGRKRIRWATPLTERPPGHSLGDSHLRLHRSVLTRGHCASSKASVRLVRE